MTAAYRLHRAMMFALRPRTHGVHAMAFTPSGHVVLVRLTYAPGWRLPGGGRKKREESVAAMLRELREEIGLTAYSSIEHAHDCEERTRYGSDRSAVFVLRGAEYRPRPTWEIEEVREFAADALPAYMPPRTRDLIDAVVQRRR
jgi:8-oxo-dGTP pyrophosphatase MutT (NUDIX family)